MRAVELVLLSFLTAALAACTNVRVLSAYDGGGEIASSGPEENVEVEEYLKSRCPVNGYTVLVDERVVIRVDQEVRTIQHGAYRERVVVDVPVTERRIRYECAAAYTPGAASSSAPTRTPRSP